MVDGRHYSTSGVTMFEFIPQPRVFTADLIVCIFILSLAYYCHKRWDMETLLPAVIITPMYLFFAILWQMARSGG